MKANKKGDDLLREKLNNYSSAVPAGMFDAIDKKRKSQQSKAAAWGWPPKLGVLSLALVLAMGVYYWQFSGKTESQTTAELSHTTTASASIFTDKNTSEGNNKVQTTVQNTIAAANPKEDIPTAETSTFLVVKKEDASRKSNSITNSAKKSKSISFPSSKSTNNESIFSNKKQSSPTKAEEIIFSEKSNEIEPISTENNAPSISAPVAKQAGKAKDTDINLESTTVTRTSFAIQALSQNNVFTIKEKSPILSPIKCSNLVGKRSYMYLDAIASLDLAFRTLTPKDSESDVYAILRNSTEGIQESFSLGFRASSVFRLRNKDSHISNTAIALRSGLIYSQINEPFRLNIYTEQTTEIIIRDDNNEIIGRDTLVEEIVQEYRSANRYKLIDVPFIVGYEIDQEKFNVSVNGGAYLNISTAQKGNFLNSDEEIVTFTSTRPDHYEAFKTNVGLSLYGSFSVNYKITPTIHFIFEPYGRYYMNSFTLDSYELDQKYFTGGIQMGLRMKM